MPAGVFASIASVSGRAYGAHLAYDSAESLIAPYGGQAALPVASDLEAGVGRRLKTAAR